MEHTMLEDEWLETVGLCLAFKKFEGNKIKEKNIRTFFF